MYEHTGALLAACLNRRDIQWVLIHDFYNMYTAMGYALALVSVLTFAFKHYVGRYRPDFYTILNTGDVALIKDGGESYPSGHASMTMSMAVTMAWYLAGKLQPTLAGHRAAEPPSWPSQACCCCCLGKSDSAEAAFSRQSRSRANHRLAPITRPRAQVLGCRYPGN